MNLAELNADERLALVGLLMMIVFADGHVSEDEGDEVQELIDAFGEGGYRAAVDGFEERFADAEAFKRFLAGVERQEARELIYGTALGYASTDAIVGEEAALLDWLAKRWGIEVKVEEEAPAEDDTTA
jgi:prepilin-type processing-associated H-X9-DG protein